MAKQDEDEDELLITQLLSSSHGRTQGIVHGQANLVSQQKAVCIGRPTSVRNWSHHVLHQPQSHEGWFKCMSL